MKLSECVSNPQALVSIFGHFPNFIGEQITTLLLHQDGPTIDMIVDLAQTPKSPPKRWKEKFNGVSVELSFFGVESLSLTNWSNINIIKDFSVEMEEVSGINWKNVELTTEEGVRFSFRCIDIRVTRITPALFIENE